VAGIQDNADQSRLFDRLPGPAIRITLCQLFDIVWLEIQVFGIKNKYAEMIGKNPNAAGLPRYLQGHSKSARAANFACLAQSRARLVVRLLKNSGFGP
jgi:hypothetical protein